MGLGGMFLKPVIKSFLKIAVVAVEGTSLPDDVKAAIVAGLTAFLAHYDEVFKATSESPHIVGSEFE